MSKRLAIGKCYQPKDEAWHDKVKASEKVLRSLRSATGLSLSDARVLQEAIPESWLRWFLDSLMVSKREVARIRRALSKDLELFEHAGSALAQARAKVVLPAASAHSECNTRLQQLQRRLQYDRLRLELTLSLVDKAHTANPALVSSSLPQSTSSK